MGPASFGGEQASSNCSNSSGSIAAHLAAAPRGFAHGGEPGVDIGGLDLAHQGDAPFLFKVRAHLTQGRAVPLQGLGAVVAPLVIEQVVLNSARWSCSRGGWPAAEALSAFLPAASQCLARLPARGLRPGQRASCEIALGERSYIFTVIHAHLGQMVACMLRQMVMDHMHWKEYTRQLLERQERQMVNHPGTKRCPSLSCSVAAFGNPSHPTAWRIALRNICLCFCNGHGLLLFQEWGKDRSGPAESPHAPSRGMKFETVEKADVR
jgi:hypothetical protein